MSTSTVTSACPLDCPDACSLVVTVEDGRVASVDGIHLMPILKAARRRGARLVVVDPRRTSLAAGADLHVPLRPGTDAARTRASCAAHGRRAGQVDVERPSVVSGERGG